MDHNKQPEQDRRFSDAVTGASKRWSSMENRMDALEEKLDRNTEMTQTIVNLFSTMESGMKFLGWLGAALKWAVSVAGALVALWAILHGKDMPQ